MAKSAITPQRYIPGISVADTTMFAEDSWEAFFGKPKTPIVSNPYANQHVENYDLPDALVGKNKFLGEIVRIQVLSDNNALTTRILPMKEANGLTLTWNKWTFDATSTDVVPEEAPSRLVRSSMDTKTAVLSRQGLALQLEHGFMKTERGRLNYLYNLRQIAQAVQEGANYDVIVALLTADEYAYGQERRYGKYNSLSIRDKLAEEKANWAITQKDGLGFKKLDAKITESQNRYQDKGKGDTWLIPPAIQMFVTFQPVNTDYYLSGRRFDADRMPVGMVNNKEVFVLRQYETRGSTEVRELTLRERQIGEYYIMADRYMNNYSLSDAYASAERAIDIFDEDKDDWARISLRSALEHVEGIFDSQGNIKGVDQRDFKELHFDGDKKYDFLLMPDESRADKARVPIQCWGQMRTKDLPPSSVLSVSKSIINALNLSPTVTDKLEALIQTLRTGKEISPDQLTQTKILAMFGSVNATPFIPDATRYAKLPLPPKNKIYQLPSAVGSPVALAQQVADDPNFKSLIARLNTLLKGSYVIDGKWASAGQMPVDHRAALENLFGYDGLRIWIRKNPSGKNAEDDVDIINHNVISTLTTQLVTSFGDAIKAEVSHVLNAVGNGVFYKTTLQKAFQFRTQFVYLVQLYLLQQSTSEGALKTALAGVSHVVKTINTPTLTEAGIDAAWGVISSTFKNMQTQVDRSAVVVSKFHVNQALKGPFIGDKFDDVGAGDWIVTDLVLLPGQIKMLVSSLLSTSKDEKDLQVTISNPLRANEPLVTLQSLQQIQTELDHLLQAYESDMSNARSLPIAKILQRMASSGVGARGVKRMPTADANKKGGKRARVFLEPEDAMDLEAGDGDDYHRGRGAAEELIRYSYDLGALPMLSGKRFAKQYQTLSQQSTTGLLLLVAKVFLATPITRQHLFQLEQNNIRVPLGVALFRPHMRYGMHLGIKVQAGAETGNTMVAFADFEVSDDARYKMHYGHFTCYTKPIVYKPENVYVAYDIFCAETRGGAGTKWVDRLSYVPSSQNYGNGDLIATLLSLEESENMPNPIDASGHFAYFTDDANLDRDNDTKPHYSLAARMNALWGFRVTSISEQSIAIIDRSHPVFADSETRIAPTHNTVMWWGTQWNYNRISQRWDEEHVNTGHFGDFVYPGCVAARRGGTVEWKKPVRFTS